jgi:hypothetical protein
MTAIKDLFDLLSKARDEVKDRDAYERYRQMRDLAEKVEDDSVLLKRENTALHEQLGLARVKAAESLLAKEEENAMLRMELRSLKSGAQPEVNRRFQPSVVVESAAVGKLISPSESIGRLIFNAGIERAEIEIEKDDVRDYIQQPASSPLSQIEVLDTYLAVVIRKSVIAIRNDIAPRRAKTVSRSELLGIIQTANQNEPIDPELTFDTLVSKALLKRSYGDRFELTSNAYHLIGESK